MKGKDPIDFFYQQIRLLRSKNWNEENRNLWRELRIALNAGQK